MTHDQSDFLDELTLALTIADDLIAGTRPEQWSAPTPCTEWDVHRLVEHIVGMNLVFAAMLTDQPLPQRDADHLGEDPLGAYRSSASALQHAFAEPGVLLRTFQGPLGAVTGIDRLQIRLYDLLAHCWDLARATGQSVEFPEATTEHVLAFAESQLATQDRRGRFDPARPVADGAPAIDRLVAFLGRLIPPT